MKFRGKRKDIKEYIKYEDGKIISIEVEQESKPQGHDHYEQAVVIPEKPFTETLKTKIKSYFTRDKLKILGIILLSALFLFALYDTYKAFSVTPSQTVPAPTSSPTMFHPTNTPKSTPVATLAPILATQAPVLLPSNTDTKPSPVATLKPTPPVASVLTTELSVVKDLLAVANLVDTTMISASNEEITNIQSYQNKAVNIVVLQTRLEKDKKQKEDLFTTLISYKAMYQKQSMESLYQATENRLLESLLFSKQVATWLDTGNNSFDPTIEEYKTKDNLRLVEQQNQLIEALKTHNIPYKLNATDNQVEYTIQ
jgi:hypothetical protein